MTDASSLDRAVARHRAHWGDPEVVARAPGRVNLIGEHTDYNDGFTLPMALPFDTVVTLTSHGDDRTGPVEIEAAGYGTVTIDPGADPRGPEVPSWARHLAGVVHLLSRDGIPSGGWRGVIETDIPIGASLSSSAALEVAVITALLGRAGVTWTPVEVARLGQRVENEVVGIPSGIMDQLISAGATAGHASLMDCRDLSLTPAPLPDGVAVVVMDSGTRRELAEAAYGERRAACERAVAELGVAALRDVTVEQVATLVDPVVRRRARHVVTEIERTRAAAVAMEAGDVKELGRLFSESHVSLRDDYEVSGPGLDLIVEAAGSGPGCLGARMTGGGFAGCAVALVEADEVGAFSGHIADTYRFDGHRAELWVTEPSAGASLLPLPAIDPGRSR